MVPTARPRHPRRLLAVAAVGVLTTAAIVALLLGAGGNGGGDEQEVAVRQRSTTTVGAPGTEPGFDSPPASEQPGGGAPGGGGSGGGAGSGGGSGSGTGNPPEDEPIIIVGGPTLDNDYPAAFGLFGEAGQTQCTVMTLRDEPQNHIEVVVTAADAPWVAGANGGTGPCGQLGPGSEAGVPRCETHTFGAGALACRLYVTLPAGTEELDYYDRVVAMTLEVRCIDRVTGVCTRLPESANPTGEEPVLARWSVSWRLKACLISVPEPVVNGEEVYLSSGPRCEPPPSSSVPESGTTDTSASG